MSVDEANSVAEAYASRLRARETEVARLARLHDRIGNGRLALGVVFLLVAAAVLLERAIAPVWLLLPAIAFAALVLYHSSVRRARVRAERAVTYYREGIARIEDRWTGLGPTGQHFAGINHIYSSDLDLFGEGSLFQLISAARTRMGEETLARWLLGPSPVDTIRQRQASVQDLRARLDLREEMAILGDDPKVGVNPGSLLA